MNPDMKGNELMNSNKLKIIAIPLLIIWLIVFFILTIIPAIVTFIVSFMRSTPQIGIPSSDFVGWDNYVWVFQLLRFPSLITNSFILAVVPAIIAIIIAFPVAFIVGSMNAGRLRSVTIGLLLLPAFVPDPMLANLFFGMLKQRVIVDDPLYSVMVIVISSITPAAICAFVGACAAGLYRDRGKKVAFGAISGVIVGIVVNLVRFLSNNMELIALLHRPRSESVEAGFDDFMFHSLINIHHLSRGATVWGFRTILQFISAIVLCIIVFLFIRIRRNESITSNIADIDTSFARAIFGFASALLFLVLLILPFFLWRNPVRFIEVPLLPTFYYSPLLTVLLNALIITIASGVVFIILFMMITTWCYAYFGKMAIALILILSTPANNIIGDFIVYWNLGLTHSSLPIISSRWNLSLMNNYTPVILSGILNLSFVLAVAYLAHLRRSQVNSFTEYIRTIGPYVMAFSGVFVANTWGSYYIHRIYRTPAHSPYIGMRNFWILNRGNIVLGYQEELGFTMLFILPVLIIGIVTVLSFTYIDSKAQEVMPDTLLRQEINPAAVQGQPEQENLVTAAGAEEEEDA